MKQDAGGPLPQRPVSQSWRPLTCGGCEWTAHQSIPWCWGPCFHTGSPWRWTASTQRWMVLETARKSFHSNHTCESFLTPHRLGQNKWHILRYLVYVLYQFYIFNPLRATFFRVIINIYLQFMSFLHIDMAHVLKNPPSSKIRTYIFYLVNIMSADVLAT